MLCLDLNEAFIFKSFQNADVSSFDYYYNKFHQKVYGNVVKLIHDEKYAEDILQEVFLSFWNNRASIKSQDTVAGWLFTTSYNRSIDFLKKQVAQSSILISNNDFLEQIMDTPAIDEAFYQKQLNIISEAVAHLPPRKKEIFTLCKFEGHAVDIVAERTGLTLTSVKDYLKQSTRMVKNYIQKQYPNETVWVMMIIAFLYQ